MPILNPFLRYLSVRIPVFTALFTLYSCASTSEPAPLTGLDMAAIGTKRIEVTLAKQPQYFTIETGLFFQSEILTTSGEHVPGVILRGRFETPGWLLSLQDMPVRIEADGSFNCFIPNRPPGNHFPFSASGPAKKSESGLITIRELPD